MNGIAGVLPQGPQGLQQAPGQAAPPGQGQPPMPGMKPPMGGAPAGITSDNPEQLAKLNEQMLVQLFNLSMMGQIKNPQPISVLGAISLKNKQKAAEEAVRNQMLQGQNAQNQQSGTVAQQELTQLQAAMQPQGAMQAPPVMARHGGAMHSYNRGGIVGYQSGGTATSYPVEEQEDITTLPLNERIRRTLERLLGREKEEGPRRWEEAQRGEAPDLMGESLVPANEPDIGQAPNMAMLGKSGDPDVDIGPAQLRAAPPPAATQRPPAVQLPPAPQAAPQAPRPAAQAPQKLDELEAAYRGLMNTQGITPAQQKAYDDVLAAQEEVRKAALMGQGKRAQAQLDRARERYENTTKGLGGLFGQRGLLEIAGGIVPEKGRVFGSLARSAAGVLEREAAERKEAAGAYELAQAAYDKELSLMDAVRVATAERNTAVARGKIDEARAAEQKRAELQVQLVKARQEREVQQRQLAADEMRAEAAKTQAGRESETDRKYRLLKKDPAAYDKMYGKEKPGLDPYQKAQLMDKASSNVLKDDKQLPVKISNAKAAAAKAGRPFDEQAFVDSLINAEYERLIAAGEGRPIKSETPVAGDVARPTTQAAFNALPKDARYINPSDGKEYIKN